MQPKGKGHVTPVKKIEGGLQRYLVLPFVKGIFIPGSLDYPYLEQAERITLVLLVMCVHEFKCLTIVKSIS